MKKMIKIMSVSLLIFSLTACKVHSQDTEDKILPEKESEKMVDVVIVTEVNSESTNNMPMTLTSNLAGEERTEVQYHWILEIDPDYKDIVGFTASEKGPQSQIVNSGQPVELDLFAEVLWLQDTKIEFKVKLQIEDKVTSNILASDEIVIENLEGIFTVQ